jgi:hypothetical protein
MIGNGTGPTVSAHLFTFRSSRDAARSLARDRRRLAQVPGRRFARLIFVGSRRSESISPGWIDPRRQLAMCVWEEEAALESFRARSPVGRSWREQTVQHCEVRMTPFRTHGTYMGEEPLAGLRPQTAPPGPVALMTFANMPARGLPYFYRGLFRAIPVLLASDGLIAAAGGPERLGRGGMTFTIWDSLPDALGFSYRRDPHRGLVENVREGDRFIDSMFLRLRPYAAEGAWFPWSRFADPFADFARSMPRAPAPARPATTPPDPASRSRTA